MLDVIFVSVYTKSVEELRVFVGSDGERFLHHDSWGFAQSNFGRGAPSSPCSLVPDVFVVVRWVPSLLHRPEVPPWSSRKAALLALLFYVQSSANAFLVFRVLLFYVASSNQKNVSGSHPGLCYSCRLALLSLLQSVCTRRVLGSLGCESYRIIPAPPRRPFGGVEPPGHRL